MRRYGAYPGGDLDVPVRLLLGQLHEVPRLQLRKEKTKQHTHKRQN